MQAEQLHFQRVSTFYNFGQLHCKHQQFSPPAKRCYNKCSVIYIHKFIELIFLNEFTTHSDSMQVFLQSLRVMSDQMSVTDSLSSNLENLKNSKTFREMFDEKALLLLLPCLHLARCFLRQIYLFVLSLCSPICRAGINKPYGEWLCNYCAMGE